MIRHNFAVGSVLLALVACGGGGGGGTPTPTTSIVKTATSGDGQHDSVGATLDLPLQVKVTEDAAAKAGASVVWSTNSAGVVLTPSGATDADGVASTTVKLGTTAGPDTIRATLSGADGSPVRFIVSTDPGAATKLGFKAAPSNVLHGGFFSPVVRVLIQDAHDNTVTSATNAVTIAITANPASGALTGGGPIAAVSGLASFPALSIDSIGDGYIITASAAGLTSVSSAAFSVTPTPPLPTAIDVTVGTGIRFRSVRNGSANPAVDTMAVGGTVTWHKAGGSHSVESTGNPSFPSSFGGNPPTTVMGASYSFLFSTAGTYSYDCGIHGAEMTGRVVVK